MASKIESIEIFPGENGGHRVVHNFKREASKKEGAMGGVIYMERPKREEHLFGASARVHERYSHPILPCFSFPPGSDFS